ncbi:hypothetical protein Sste5346_006627 [Sporothrix stenoceras]|uniref:Uncharacterized protein n=1 Tax=Sporothrix stenoceras TaxID=5173 RepID=A0ABR3YYN9_9PEZI
MKLTILAIASLAGLAAAASENTTCDTFGAWDCGGDATLGWTTVLQCAYNTPGSKRMQWRRIAKCEGETPCCDHRAVEMKGVPHCNVRPTAGPMQQFCGRA